MSKSMCIFTKSSSRIAIFLCVLNLIVFSACTTVRRAEPIDFAASSVQSGLAFSYDLKTDLEDVKSRGCNLALNRIGESTEYYIELFVDSHTAFVKLPPGKYSGGKFTCAHSNFFIKKFGFAQIPVPAEGIGYLGNFSISAREEGLMFGRADESLDVVLKALDKVEVNKNVKLINALSGKVITREMVLLSKINSNRNIEVSYVRASGEKSSPMINYKVIDQCIADENLRNGLDLGALKIKVSFAGGIYKKHEVIVSNHAWTDELQNCIVSFLKSEKLEFMGASEFSIEIF